MAYVTTYGRTCGLEGCSRPASLVVKNEYNAECNYFCDRHRKQADAMASRIDESEKQAVQR